MLNVQTLHDSIVSQDQSLDSLVTNLMNSGQDNEALIQTQLAIHVRLGDLLEMMSLKR